MRRRFSLAVLAAVALAVPALCFGVAEAQQPATSTYNTTCDRKPSEGDENAARAYFTIGKKAYDEADYQKAIDNLKEAYKLDCTKPILLNYVASAYIAKGDKAEAIAALEAFTKRDAHAADAEGVPRKIANLKQALAAQSATASATTPTTSTATTTSTTPTSTATTTTAPTTTDTVPPPERGHTVLPWIVVGVGGAAMVTGIILLAVGSSKVSDSFNICPNGNCGIDPGGGKNRQATALNSDGRAFQNIGIAVGLVGVAAVGGGLLWHFLEPTGPAKSARIRPELGPGWAGVSGAF
jgi:tetratricopeptide (TPR) repeat protein